MKSHAILAAAYLGPEGRGNDESGLQPWASPLAEALQRGRLDLLHWSIVSDSDPSRFARMDLMCRLGLMAVELLHAGFESMPEARRQRIGVCLDTFAGCLDTDLRFARTPRPSLFTYTLPSTLIGEVCIRYRLQGPVLCLISEDSGASAAAREGLEWLQAGDADACLCLRCEAIDAGRANAGGIPGELRGNTWHACALLLGPRQGAPREYPLEPRSLKSLCLELCSRPNRAC